MGWAYQWRGVLLALALSVLGHVWVGFIWRAPVVPPMLLTASGASGPVPIQAVTRVRLVSLGTDAAADSLPQATEPPSPLADTSLSPQESGGLQMGAFVPSAKLDSPLVPMSAPDTSRLEGLYFSGQPIRLRLLVTDTGRVAEVLTLHAVAEDEEAVAHIKAMLLDTTYSPGRLDGKPVAAQVDMELRMDDLD